MDNIIDKLSTMLNERRLNHSIGTMETAVMLAKIYGEDEEKARIAGVLHDCAKCIPKEEAFHMCKKNGIILDGVENIEYKLMHAPLGAYIAQTEFGVTDSYIKNAIRYHTTGRENMTLLEKIIYLADMIEPNRKYDNLPEIRIIAKENLDLAVKMSMDISIASVVRKNVLIHKNSILARNELIRIMQVDKC